MTYFLFSWAVASAVYVLCAGQFSADELAAAALCGLAASLWATSLRRAVGSRFRFEREAWAATWRAVRGVPAATGKVALALTKAVAVGASGDVQRQQFIHGKVHDPLDAGRRAVAVLAGSLAPDGFVVRAPDGEDSLDLHALVKSSEENPRWVV